MESKKKQINFLIFLLVFLCILSIKLYSENSFAIGRIKYSGGGDWYADKTSIPNVLSYISKIFNISVSSELTVELKEDDLYKTPFVYITGHGNLKMSEKKIVLLRQYLINGGFLYIDDCYGMDKSVRKILKKIFPESNLIKLPFNHLIYHIYYDFPAGPPKIHEHDNIPPEGYGIYYNDRLVIYYTFNADIGCGIEDAWVHNDPPEVRDKAMKMFSNIILYVLLN